MHIEHRQAFTMLELTFVIVVIGILSAIAIPRFANTADSAYTTKAQSTLATVRTALATERQRRILRGDFATAITDLSMTSANAASAFVFDHFSRDAAGNNTPIFDYPIRACATGQRACWVKSGAAAPFTYTYRFSSASTGTNGQADFTLANNRLDCISTDTTDCQLITQ